MDQYGRHAERVGNEARAEVARQGVADAAIAVVLRAHLRYQGTDTPLPVTFAATATMTSSFEEMHRQRFGFVMAGRPLVVEALSFFVRSDLYAEAAALLSRLGDLRRDGQVMLAEVEVLLWQGEAKAAEALLDKGIELPGIREGANRLAELWREVQAALGTDRPVPEHYDFTMF